jgi:hypothetical protein
VLAGDARGKRDRIIHFAPYLFVDAAICYYRLVRAQALLEKWPWPVEAQNDADRRLAKVKLVASACGLEPEALAHILPLDPHGRARRYKWSLPQTVAFALSAKWNLGTRVILKRLADPQFRFPP